MDKDISKAKYLGKVCPITDGTCDRKCGYGAHMTIKRAPIKLKNRLTISDEPVIKEHF